MRRWSIILAVLAACSDEQLEACASWLQWGGAADHQGASCVAGQRMQKSYAEVEIDPFVEQEAANDEGDLLVHYQSPLISGDDVFVQKKAGTYTPCMQPIPPDRTATCAPYRWDTEEHHLLRLSWEDGRLVERWEIASDWKPEPISGFQPAFQPALCGDFLWVPARGGTLLQVDRESGATRRRVNPFGEAIDVDTYVAGPVTADAGCNAYYNALKIDHDNPWLTDATGWLVKVTPAGEISRADYTALTAGIAPASADPCYAVFRTETSTRPWPPPPNPDGSPALPGTTPCFSQRPAIGAAPAISPVDGTIFVVSRAHRRDRYSYLVAVKPDLSVKWVASLRDRLRNGCGVLIPSDGDEIERPFNCRPGATEGVDPVTNQLPAGRALDSSSSSPVALPDGGVIYGAFTGHNGFKGHTFMFDAAGSFIGAYGFGWDTTPSIWEHDGTYSIILKENNYLQDENGVDLGPFLITQLSKSLEIEWQYRNTNTKSCRRGADDQLICVDDHPNSFEWCVNAGAVDKDGTFYANSEDGNVYAIAQGGVERERFFLEMAIAAAYTPLALDGAGRIYTMNDGKLNVLGE